MSEILRVRATEDMPPEDFRAHLAVRHNQQGELGGLKEVSLRGATRDRSVWEAYHERLHETREYTHEH